MPKLRLRAIVSFALSTLMLLSTVVAQDSEILIKDTAGITRAASQVDGSGVVQFGVETASGAAADGIEVTLTNIATGETMIATAANGTVAFEAVAPGAWTVASTTAGATFTNVTIGSMVAIAGVGGITAGTLGLGALAVGGTTAVAISATDDSSSSSPLSPAS